MKQLSAAAVSPSRSRNHQTKDTSSPGTWSITTWWVAFRAILRKCRFRKLTVPDRCRSCFDFILPSTGIHCLPSQMPRVRELDVTQAPVPRVRWSWAFRSDNSLLARPPARRIQKAEWEWDGGTIAHEAHPPLRHSNLLLSDNVALHGDDDRTEVRLIKPLKNDVKGAPRFHVSPQGKWETETQFRRRTQPQKEQGKAKQRNTTRRKQCDHLLSGERNTWISP